MDPPGRTLSLSIAADPPARMTRRQLADAFQGPVRSERSCLAKETKSPDAGRPKDGVVSEFGLQSTVSSSKRRKQTAYCDAPPGPLWYEAPSSNLLILFTLRPTNVLYCPNPEGPQIVRPSKEPPPGRQ
jgi:hypothetical protein